MFEIFRISISIKEFLSATFILTNELYGEEWGQGYRL